MLKIGFLYFGNPLDNTYWSGTIHAIHDAIESIPDVELIDLIVEQSKINRLVYMMTRLVSLKKNELSPLMTFIGSERVNGIVESSGCDIIFAPAGSKLIYTGRKALSKKKIIYLSDATYHGMLGYYYMHSLHDQKIGNNWEMTAHKMSNAVILASNWARQDALSFYKTSNDKISVINFGSNMNDVGHKVISADKKCYKLLLVGVDWKRKGIDIAIDCVRLLNEEAGTIKYDLTIIGVDSNSISYPNYIKFIGRLDKNDSREYLELEKLYMNSDIFILPTQAECAGIVFAEAAMFGLPVFTCATGGVTDYVVDDVTGRCLDIGASGKDFKNAIEESIKTGRITQYSQNARKKYEEDLNWSVWADHFKTVITTVMND